MCVSDEVTNRCVSVSDEVSNRCEVLCVFQMRSPTGVRFCVLDEVTNRYVRFCASFR